MAHIPCRPLSISPHTSGLSDDMSRPLPAAPDSGFFSSPTLFSESPPSSSAACSLHAGDDKNWLDESAKSAISTVIAQETIDLGSNMIDAWKALPRSKAQNHSKSRLRESPTAGLSGVADSPYPYKGPAVQTPHGPTRDRSRASPQGYSSRDMKEGTLEFSPIPNEVTSKPPLYVYSSPGFEDSLDHEVRRRIGVGQPSTVAANKLGSIPDPVSPPAQRPRPPGEGTPISLDRCNEPIFPVGLPHQDLRWGSLAEAGMTGWTDDIGGINGRQQFAAVHTDRALAWCDSQEQEQEDKCNQEQEVDEQEVDEQEVDEQEEYRAPLLLRAGDNFDGSWRFEQLSGEPDLGIFAVIDDLRVLSLCCEFDGSTIFVDAPVDDQRSMEFWL